MDYLVILGDLENSSVQVTKWKQILSKNHFQQFQSKRLQEA